MWSTYINRSSQFWVVFPSIIWVAFGVIDVFRLPDFGDHGGDKWKRLDLLVDILRAVPPSLRIHW